MSDFNLHYLIVVQFKKRTLMVFSGIDNKKDTNGWFCERVFVKNEVSGEQVEFRVFNWLLTEIWIAAGEGLHSFNYNLTFFSLNYSYTQKNMGKG